jgi:intein/homing endonuclease
MKNLSVEYLAGFFDGEGSVGLYYDKSEKRWRANIEITQNYSRWAFVLFDTWAKEFAGRVYITKRKVLVLMIRGEGIRKFIRAMDGLTRLKTRQLIVLEQYLETKEFPYRAAQLLKTLNRST